jgi:hypothetical protein
MRGIQYAAASRINRWRLWNTGSPAFAGDDDLKTVIARSEATKQSISPRKEGSWIASRSLSSGAHSRDPLARNDVERASSHTFAFSPRHAPEVCSELSALSKVRAQGMPGARCARGLVCKCSGRCAHEHTGHTGITRHSPRNGLRLITCSPLRPGFFATVIRSS